MTFRAVYSTVIIVPTALILILYGHFHVILWRRDVTKNSISRQNVRAARITFLIMLTCTLGWLPAVVNHLLICNEGCRYEYVMPLILPLNGASPFLIFFSGQRTFPPVLCSPCTPSATFW